ncbi:MAG: bifunctional riboflavin kinase/FAD synthetase [Pseudohongiellaceae bacterium]
MIIVDEPERFAQLEQHCVATIGKFDGVHLGHQLILDQVKSKAEELDLPSLVILIEPHPEEFFAGSDGDCPARLTSLREKLALLDGFGIEYVYQLRFDRTTSELDAEAWVENILVQGLGVKAFIVGNDFRFGFKRQGDFALLREKGREYGFEVLETVAYERNGQRISSTFIRERLAAAEFDLVEQLLGRPYSMTGEVEKGRQLGTDLGFPTCNINPHRRRIPLHGVYACQVRMVDRYLPAAVNIGYRPTVSEDGDALLEAHILDFDANLYGRTIEVIFHRKLRDEIKFESLEALKHQIATDVAEVREVFATAAAE